MGDDEIIYLVGGPWDDYDSPDSPEEGGLPRKSITNDRWSVFPDFLYTASNHVYARCPETGEWLYQGEGPIPF